MAAPLPHVADGILTDVGDLFSWLESGIESVVSIIEDAANDVWRFVVSIAGKVYYGILDAVEKVVAAAVWIYNAIKIIIQDIILFLEFLFLWQDILVTHRVMKNVFTQLVQFTIDGLNDVKGDLSLLFKQAQADIDKWANIPNFDQTPVERRAPIPARGPAQRAGQSRLSPFPGQLPQQPVLLSTAGTCRGDLQGSAGSPGAGGSHPERRI